MQLEIRQVISIACGGMSVAILRLAGEAFENPGLSICNRLGVARLATERDSSGLKSCPLAIHFVVDLPTHFDSVDRANGYRYNVAANVEDFGE